MRFDVDRAIEQHTRRREERAARVSERVMFDVDLEARLLAAILGDVGVLERCGDVELDDFSDYRHRAVFIAVRALETRGELAGPCEVADEIERRDLEQSKCVSEHAGIFFVASLVIEHAPFWGCEHSLAWTKQHLRKLAERRRAV